MSMRKRKKYLTSVPVEVVRRRFFNNWLDKVTPGIKSRMANNAVESLLKMRCQLGFREVYKDLSTRRRKVKEKFQARMISQFGS